MAKNLNKEQLHDRLVQLDTDLTHQGVPLRFRPLECFKAIHGPVPYGELRMKLFDAIIGWFVERYGQSAAWDGVVGRIPVLLRDELYLVQVPFTTEETLIKLTDRFEALPKHVAETFSPEEFDQIGRKINAGTEAIYTLYNLNVDDHILDHTERALVRRALFDFEHTATSLKQTGDTQNAVFHSHAAAEKFLKAALKRSGGQGHLRSLGHDLRKVFSALVQRQSRFSWLKSSVDALQDAVPSMEIRYSDVPRTMAQAVVCFNAALSICGTLARTWLLDELRGCTQATFVPGRFYIDGARRTFRCKTVSPDAACLTNFRFSPAIGVIVADMTLDPAYASLYLEISKPEQVRSLQTNYDFCIKNATHSVTPDQLRVEIASGAEGSYVTYMRTIQLRMKSDNDNK